MKPTIIIFGLAGVMLATAALAQQSVEDCRAIDDDQERLACFDAVLAPQKPAAPGPAPEPAPERAARPAATPAPQPAGTPAASASVLTDEVGRETLRDEARDELEVRGRVERCVKGRSGKYVFYFDNGQVWRQRGNARANWKDCAFDVVISKDAFGYSLVKVGETRRVRIDRVR